MTIDLKKVLAYSKDSLQSRATMRGIIKDLYPDATREMNVLLDVYESGVPRAIKRAGSITDMQYSTYIQKIINDYGLQEQYAVEGLNAWIDICIAPGTAARLRKPAIKPNQNVQAKPTVKTQSVCNVSGSELDFELKDLGNNQVEITKFRGFDEKELTVPSEINGKKVIGIGEDAYKGCQVVEKVVIAEGIRYIGAGAFADCAELQKVIFPNTLRKIGKERMGWSEKGAFQETKIQEVMLPDELAFLGEKTFFCCFLLNKVEFPESLHEIGGFAFSGCNALKRVNLNEGLIKIGYYAFNRCTSLETVTLPETLKEIGGEAFKDCMALEEIILPASVDKIGKNAFAKVCFGKKVTIFCYPGSKALDYARENGHPVKNALQRS